MYRGKLQFLVKWEGYGMEENSWVDEKDVVHAPDRLADFYANHPGAPRQIRAMEFASCNALGHRMLEGG